MKRISSSLAFALLLAATGMAAELPTITVDAGKVIAPVNPFGFGNNLEAADGRGIFGEKADAPTFNLNGVKYGQGFWDPAKNQVNPETTALARKLNMGMMRYPGGCLAHNFNWKQAVGPLSERPEWKFGIDQYLELCRVMDWEPLFTLTDYALPADQLPQHFAELVEYLNAPAVPEHPWAMKRAKWGHPEPYGVKYFEIGNESNHGSHHTIPTRVYTPEEYVKYARESMAAMRKIDPSIQLGIVTVPGNGLDFNCDWNRKIIAGAGDIADFLVIHFYGPGIAGSDAETALSRVLAYPDQLPDRMKAYRDLTRELTGRELPLAITEYNIGGTTDQPFQHRFSYLAGLMNAELMRLWQLPENKVIFANYWHILNGFWGAYRSDDATGKITRKQATLPFFEAWAKFRGSEIVQSEITGAPRIEAESASGLLESRGDAKLPPKVVQTVEKFQFNLSGFAAGSDLSARAQGENALTFTLKERKANNYGVFTMVPRPTDYPKGSMTMNISFDARFLPADPGRKPQAIFGLGMCDPRGWDATQSAIAVTGAQAAIGEWKHFAHSFSTLSDAPGADILFRFENAAAPVSGTVEFKNLKVEIKSGATYPAYPALSSFASRSADGKTLYLIVFNRAPKKAVTARIDLKEFPAVAGESLELFQEKVDTVEYFEGKTGSVTLKENSFTHTFPEHSMTAFEFHRR